MMLLTLPRRNAHIYGIDLADTKELVAYNRTDEEIATEIGADSVIYQTLPNLIRACSNMNPLITSFEVGVFNGEYVTGVDPEYFKYLESLRGETARAKKKEAALQAVNAGIATKDDVGLILANGMNGDVCYSPNDVSLHNVFDSAR